VLVERAAEAPGDRVDNSEPVPRTDNSFVRTVVGDPALDERLQRQQFHADATVAVTERVTFRVVISSDTIKPSRQQRSEFIRNGRSMSRSSMPLLSSLERLIARHSCRRYAAASMQLLYSVIARRGALARNFPTDPEQSTAFASLLVECAAATEIAPMAEVNSLLIRCENSRSSRRASEEDCFEDGISIDCIITRNL
jgi:hypothetical protein